MLAKKAPAYDNRGKRCFGNSDKRYFVATAVRQSGRPRL